MRSMTKAAVIGGSVIAAAASAVGGVIVRNLHSYDVGVARARRAGYVEKQAAVDGSRLNYAEGPSGGEPLLLIPGQGVTWQHYYRVLPKLANDFHVYVVDVHGHGGSERTPEKYTAKAIGTDLGHFIDQVIGRPVVVSGHSSGGQLAAWLGGNRPDVVRGVVLEDPPLFTTLLPRAKQTWNWLDLATLCHDFLSSGKTDWPAYHFEHQRLWEFFGELGPKITDWGLKQHAGHEGGPITFPFMPPGFNDMQRGMATYDPRFGDAFYTGSWDDGFDHAATLRAIDAPTVLIKANAPYGDDGILQGAMDDNDARAVMDNLRDARMVRVDCGHDVHGEKPAAFIAAVRSLAT